MSEKLNIIRKSLFLDSVVLMRISKQLYGIEGVQEAALMMGTPANKNILKDADLLAKDTETASGADLIIAIKAIDKRCLSTALKVANELLDNPQSERKNASLWRPKSISSAVKSAPDSNFVLVSVPGDYAAAEARKALKRGLNTMVFSDNVSLDEERELKLYAKEQGLFVMGPDCGTAIINGVPLAFANIVPDGSIGIIGASGTGTQEVSTLIARGGGGISHAIGVGGRDMNDKVGGLSTSQAIEALESDPKTTQIVIISKPPGPKTVQKIISLISKKKKKYTLCFLGGQTIELPSNANQAVTLFDAAAQTGFSISQAEPLEIAKSLPRLNGNVLGLFCGGTLASEAKVIVTKKTTEASYEYCSDRDFDPDSNKRYFKMVDLGDDLYTRGRPHPMIDPTIRQEHIKKACAQEEIGLILIDVILGYGSSDNPAKSVVDCLQKRKDGLPIIIASVTGTETDPQRRSKQIKILEEAGIIVAQSSTHGAYITAECMNLSSRENNVK
jgi:succinyl-CoA synthetase alpha subunit